MKTKADRIFSFNATTHLGNPFAMAMCPEQEFWYLRFLIWSAASDPPGSIPLNFPKLSEICRCPSVKYFVENSQPVLARFIRDDYAGVFWNKEIRAQILHRQMVSMVRSKLGKEGRAKQLQTMSKNRHPDRKGEYVHSNITA
jgi:hypothetical protein